jgi:4-amino-4-deoxy-L-arabinose transferase-like glycosyltransferase
LAAIFTGYLLLAGFYAFVNLAGDAPDEPAHVAYARYLEKTGREPVFERSPFWPRYEALQPPLYYQLLAWVSPWTERGHTKSAYVRMRMLSVLLHGLALLAVYGTARLLMPGREGAALAAAAALALEPMFCFIGASVTNDAAVNLAAACLVFSGARLAAGTGGWPATLAFGLAWGLGMESKASAAVLGAFALLYLLWRRKLALGPAFAAAFLALAIAAPTLIRDWRLYGDPLALHVVHKTDPVGAGVAGLPRWAVTTFESAWAVFGWMILRVPSVYYGILALLTAVAAAGAAAAWRRGTFFDRGVAPFLAAVGALVLAQSMWFGTFTFQAQGRQLFVGLAAFVPLLWGGVQFLLETASRPVRRFSVAALLALAAALQVQSLSRLADAQFVIPGVYNPKGV